MQEKNMKKIISLLVIYFTVQSIIAQPSITWQKTYGGSLHEYTWKTIPTADGGYAFVGFSDSNDGDVLSESNGGTDLWVAKITSTGTIQWSKLFGGTGDEEGHDIMQTADNGFLVTGYTGSSDGDVVGHHGTSSNDFWVLKLTSAGVLEWNQCYGGTSSDEAAAMGKTTTGDYYVAGSTYSNDGDVSGGNHSSDISDFWVIKINSSGSLLSQKCVGGTDSDEGINMTITSDNGCILVGRTSSTDGDAIAYHGGQDMLIAKLTSSFTVEWSKCYGGTETEECNAVVQLSDGSYAALGYSSTHNNGDVTGHHGSQGSDDFWLLKLTSAGAITWAKCFGGDGDDQANGLTKTMDGGYVMCGLTNSTNGDVTGFHSGGFFDPDVWVAKIDANGILKWQRCCGGSGQDESFNVFETSSNQFIVTAFTYSADYDITQNRGSADGWIFNLAGASSVQENFLDDEFTVFPNPFTDHINVIFPLTTAAPEKLILTNSIGEQIKIIEHVTPKLLQFINTKHLSAGVYYIELIGTEYSILKKIIKE